MPKRQPHWLVLVIILSCVIGALIVGAGMRLASPPDEFANHAPPAGPNAKVDPPNPDKAKHLPSASPGQ